MIYTLTGFMGSGKSTVGRLLAADGEDSRFIDLDEHIALLTGRSIPELFARGGESAFRDAETEALMDAVTCYEGGTLILALGGGTLCRERNREIVRATSHCIYLQGSTATLAAHLDGAAASRPLLQGEGSLEEKIGRLLEGRIPVYRAATDYTVDIDGKTPAQIADEIRHLVFLRDY